MKQSWHCICKDRPKSGVSWQFAVRGMSDALMGATLESRASLLREVKGRICHLFTQERVAQSAVSPNELLYGFMVGISFNKVIAFGLIAVIRKKRASAWMHRNVSEPVIDFRLSSLATCGLAAPSPICAVLGSRV